MNKAFKDGGTLNQGKQSMGLDLPGEIRIKTKLANDGGPAFPVPNLEHDDGFNGMTLRDYFAAKAMQAAATNPTGADGFDFQQMAEWAYAQADAMLKARVV